MDLRDLAPLYRLSGPVVTAYVDLAGAHPEAARRREAAWKRLLLQLIDEEVDLPTIEAVAAAKPKAPFAGATQVLVAAAGSVHLNRQLAAPSINPSAAVGALPQLLPLIERHIACEVAERADHDEQVVLDHYARALGRHEGAVSGLDDVVSALQQGLVATLVVRTPDPIGGTLYYGPQSADLARSPDELAALGIAEITSAPACDVILRAAAHSAASVLTVASDQRPVIIDGVGAILRVPVG